MDFKLKNKVYERKKRKLLDKLEENDFDALCLFSPTYISNLTGFPFIPTERPIAYILDKEREDVVVPRLEKEHIDYRSVKFDNITTYPDYPGRKHPMKYVKEMIKEKDYNKIAVDQDGYGSGYGYFGPSLSELIDIEIEDIRLELEKFFSVKEDEEIKLLEESAKWANLGLRYLYEETEPGLSEVDISMKASVKASQAMVRTLGDKYEQTGMGQFPVSAGYRG